MSCSQLGPRTAAALPPLCRRAFLAALFATVVCTAGPVRAQAPVTPSAEAAAASAEPTPVDELDRGTPRGAMLGYLESCRSGNYQQAARYLDLSRTPKDRRDGGPKLARELKVVLDRTLWIEPDALSADSDGNIDDSLPEGEDLVGIIKGTKRSWRVLLDRVRAEDGTPIWKISSTTVTQIPALYQEFGYGRLGEFLPAPFFEWQFLEVQLWQWLGLGLLIVLAALGGWIVTAAGLRIIRLLLSRRARWAERTVHMSRGPLRLFVAVSLFAAGMYALALSVPVQHFLGALQRGLAIIALAWLVIRFAYVGTEWLQRRMVMRGQMIATSIVPLGRRTAQVFIMGMAMLAVLQNFGINVGAVLAGLGIGGLAVALAAQKTVENLFGGVTLIFDQPVRVGDFCRFGDQVGTVEAVGLRSTRIRTLDRTVVTIPNGTFAGMQLENFALRDRIWLHPSIGLRYETSADQLRYVLIELKKMLLGHPKVHPDPARVRFVSFGDYSLNLEIFAYVLTADINEFLAVQEDIFLRIMDIVEASGTGFAFPSQTIYAGADTGLDEDRTRAAEEQVKQWRAQNALYLPNFPADQIAALHESLDYPPKGSPGGK